jgi:copper chaperone CopZ
MITQRDSMVRGGNEVAKLNADIRRKLQKDAKDIKSLKNALKKIDGLSQKEVTRRKTEIDQLTDENEVQLKRFNSNPNKGNTKDLFGDNDHKNIVEKDDTKHLDQEDLLKMQKRVMDQQDEGLDHLIGALDRTKQIGVVIGDELDEHKRLLDDLDGNVHKTTTNIKKQTRRIDDVIKASRIPLLLCCVIILIIIAVVVLILMLKVIIGF